jgi:coenzyme F420 biosynthesis-associated protein
MLRVVNRRRATGRHSLIPVSPNPASAPTAADLVDWDAAARLARIATPAGPHVPDAIRRASVALLRRSVDDALPWAGRITGLPGPARSAALNAEILVVDRAGLMTASAAWLRGLTGALPMPDAGPASRALATGQVGVALGYLSTRVLGQVLPRLDDPAGGDVTRPDARLLLVAPNVLAFQRRFDLDVLDLPAWVALHEAVHLVQLSAAPWLAQRLTDRMRLVIGALVAAVRNADAGRTEPDEQSDEQDERDEQPDGPPLGDLLTAPGREHLTRLVALLTLLEGHADAVLDAVEPGRMPSVHRLRAVLSRTPRSYGRGLSAGPGALLGRLIGLDAKETQYADGAAFARAVIARVGHKGLNTVWAAPDNLPLPDEIARPEQWIERLGL